MKGKDGRPFSPGDNPPPDWARPLLYASSLAFSAGARLRGAAFDAGLLPVHRVEAPVVSVGNLRVGGSGKTPFTLLVVERLRARGHRPVVVSRGYGRRGTEAPLIVPAGPPVARTSAEAGDEPVLLAGRGVSVVVDPDRVRGARLAIAELSATVIVLDDGFQHRRLARDLDIVLLNPARAPSTQAMLPRGPLREPAAALARADLVVWVGASAWPELTVDVPAVGVEVAAAEVGPTAGPRRPAATLRGVPVALMSGIARPERFAATVRGLGADVRSHEVFADHAWLTEADVRRCLERARDVGAQCLLTTEKDAVRLPATDGDIEVLTIEPRITQGEAALEAALSKLGTP